MPCWLIIPGHYKNHKNCPYFNRLWVEKILAFSVAGGVVFFAFLVFLFITPNNAI
ncbi:MAG TPA: hypothetical protein IGQ44_10305 [Geminocystis sp. M7585_C2015_104]|nr:hypothetical protein [Geminocystis sp. M7585_C2015_104]